MPVVSTPQTQAQNLNLRTALSNAYAAVEGAKAVQSFSAYTLEDALSDQVTIISGPGTPTRPNELDSIQAILNNVTQAATQIQNLPPDAFDDPNPSTDVNTPA